MDLHTLSCCSAPVIRRGPDKELSEGATPSYPTHQPSTSPPPPLFFSLCLCLPGCQWSWRLPGGWLRRCGEVPETSVTRRRRRRRREGDRTGAALFLGGYRSALSHLGCGRWRQCPGDLTEAANWGRCPAGVMVVVVVPPPQDWAWQAVLLVTGLASLTCGAHGE